jgi:hypothetical protein
MYLYLWQCFFVMYLASYIGKYQHGFMPKRGTLTAWKMLKEYIPKFPNIYEYDLKGAFPSVSITYARDRLKALGTPGPIADYIWRMSLETVEVIDRTDQKLPEPKTDRQEFLAPKLDEIYNFQVEERRQAIATFKAALDSTDVPVIDGYPVTDKDILDMVRVARLQEAGLVDDAYVEAFLNQTGPTLEDVLASQERELEKLLANPVYEPQHSDVTFGEGWSMYSAAHADAIMATFGPTEIPVEARGFPQGSGLSPILFDFVFEDAIYRKWRVALGKAVKIVAYADDFILFAKEKLSNFLLPVQAIVPESGLELSFDKSRPIKQDNVYEVMNFKFLGITVIPFGSDLLYRGTPRSGKTLDLGPEKLKAIDQYVWRDYELLKFSKALNLGVGPQTILDGWGRAESPYDLLPEEVISGDSTLKRSTIRAIKSVVKGRLDPGPPVPVDPATGLLTRKIAALDVSKIAQSLTDQDIEGYARLIKWLSKSMPSRWLGSRKAGMIMSRLHDGSWHRAADNSSAFDLAKSVPPKTEGRSWFELAAHNQLASKGVAPNLHNSTSLAMLDMLNLSRDPLHIKVRNSKIMYRLPKASRPQKGYNYKGR